MRRNALDGRESPMGRLVSNFFISLDGVVEAPLNLSYRPMKD
jgi:hypothetical protein